MQEETSKDASQNQRVEPIDGGKCKKALNGACEFIAFRVNTSPQNWSIGASTISLVRQRLMFSCSVQTQPYRVNVAKNVSSRLPITCEESATAAACNMVVDATQYDVFLLKGTLQKPHCTHNRCAALCTSGSACSIDVQNTECKHGIPKVCTDATRLCASGGRGTALLRPPMGPCVRNVL